MARYGRAQDLTEALDDLVNLAPADRNDAYVSLRVLITIDDSGETAKPIRPQNQGRCGGGPDGGKLVQCGNRHCGWYVGR